MILQQLTADATIPALTATTDAVPGFGFCSCYPAVATTATAAMAPASLATTAFSAATTTIAAPGSGF